jgi:hypothetical protein
MKGAAGTRTRTSRLVQSQKRILKTSERTNGKGDAPGNGLRRRVRLAP